MNCTHNYCFVVNTLIVKLFTTNVMRATFFTMYDLFSTFRNQQKLPAGFKLRRIAMQKYKGLCSTHRGKAHFSIDNTIQP